MIRKVKRKVDDTIFKTLLLTGALLGTMWCGPVFSQDYTSTIGVSEEVRTITTGRFEGNHLSIRPDTAVTDNQKSLPSLLVPLFTYLAKTKGKILVYPGVQSKIQVELGLSGYVGVRWLF